MELYGGDIKKCVKRSCFKNEGMGISVTAKTFMRLKENGFSPKCLGFFVGDANSVSTDVKKFLETPRQQKRIQSFLESNEDHVHSSIMPYRENPAYCCKGLKTDHTHDWRNGAIDLHWILIRFERVEDGLKLLSIYPVTIRRERKETES